LAAASPVRVRGVAGAHELLGHGYSDRVELSAPPRALALSELAWGRGQAGHDSFVFTEARFRDGRVFRRALVNGSSFTEFSLERAGEETLELAVDAWRVSLQDERCLHAGDAIDAGRFPSATERAVSRLLSGSIRERRALARVRGASGVPGHALHEHVHFGAAKGRE
jgi:hypothetical protein